MSNAVILKRCATLNEAYILQGLLRANGFDASLDEANHATVNWWLIPALGGVAIRLPRSQAEGARRTMVEIAENAHANLEEQFGPYEPPRKYGRAAIWYYWLSFFGIVQLLLAGAIILLDRLIPAAWIPAPTLAPGVFGYYGGGISVNWERAASGFVLVLFIVGLTAFDYYSTRPKTLPRKDQP